MPDTDYTSLKVGIVGAGLMGRWHLNAIKRLAANPVSIVDKNYSLAQQLASQIKNTVTLSSDIDEMFLQHQLDVVHICTPVNSHYSIAMKAIEAGVNLVVEKPLATSTETTKNLLDAAKANNVKVCPVHQFGFQDGIKRALTELGSLGDLLHLRFTTNSAGAVGQANLSLNDIIADIIPHPLSVLQRLQPGIKLDAEKWTGVQSRDGELQVTGDADGIGIDIYISMNARPTRCEMELYFTAGRIVLNFFHGYILIEKGVVSRTQKIIQPFKYSFSQLYVAAINIMKRGLSGEFAYPGLCSLLDVFYCSVKNNSSEPISHDEILSVAIARDNIIKRFLTH